tara:strand:- start:1633 stop:1902 length:270 start_codon:yes stop_codon:yes gene_type:complete
LDAWAPPQTRSISKKAKEAERNIVVKLLKDVPRYGRAGMGSAVYLQALLMRTRLLCAIEPVLDAQPMVPCPRRRLRSRYPVEATKGAGA